MSESDVVSRAERWRRLSPAFAAALREYFVATGADPESASSQSTIRTNTELVPRRADNLVTWAESLGGITSLSGVDVVELGCGFGAVATYLAATYDPALVTAVDNNASYLARATAATEKLGLDDRVRFVGGDMRELSRVVDAADLVILNNAFIYLTDGRDADVALGEIFRVLRPGGVVILHHANRLRWREPFTKDPLVHLLPRPLANLMSRVAGWKHNRDRVRLLSPFELRRRLRRCGFADVRIADAKGVESGMKRYFAPYYVVGARKPT